MKAAALILTTLPLFSMNAIAEINTVQEQKATQICGTLLAQKLFKDVIKTDSDPEKTVFRGTRSNEIGEFRVSVFNSDRTCAMELNAGHDHFLKLDFRNVPGFTFDVYGNQNCKTLKGPAKTMALRLYFQESLPTFSIESEDYNCRYDEFQNEICDTRETVQFLTTTKELRKSVYFYNRRNMSKPTRVYYDEESYAQCLKDELEKLKEESD